MDKNKKQRFSNELNSKPIVQKVCSEVIPPSFGEQYSLKFKNRINSYNSSLTRKNYPSNIYNPYWMISNSITNNITKSIKNNENELEGKSKENMNNLVIANKNINNHNTMDATKKDDIIINNQIKNIFSIFNESNKETINPVTGHLNNINKNNSGLLKRSESILNLTNVFHNSNNMQKSLNSYSSSSSSIYSSNYNHDDNNNNGNYNKIVVINSSSNNKHIKSKIVNNSNNNKESNFEDLKKNSDGSLLIDSSTTQTTDDSSIINNSEKQFYPSAKVKLNNKSKMQNKLKKYNQGAFEHINVKLRFKNLYLSKRISHKIPAKNIEYLNKFRKQLRKNNNSYVNSSSDEFPTTLYTFRQINVRFPKQFKKLSIDNHKIHTFKDNYSINKGTKNIMEKVHHKKNASKNDYIFTVECLNTITTDKNTIKSVMKYNELVKSFKNNSQINNHNMKESIGNELDKNYIANGNKYDNIIYESNMSQDFPNNIYENDMNQIFTNEIYENGMNQVFANKNDNHRYLQYDGDFIDNNLKTFYTNEGNDKDYHKKQNSENFESFNIENQQDLKQNDLLQQIQQQRLYYQENKIDYSYSCTTLSSYSSDESYLDSGDDYSVPDIANNYYETVMVSSNSMSSVTPLSFKKQDNNFLTNKASLSSITNNDLNKIKLLGNNNGSVTSPSKLEEEEESKISQRQSIKLKREDQVAPFFQSNVIKSSTPEIHNINFKLYASDATESVSSSFSSTNTTNNNKDTNFDNSLSNFIYHKPFL